MVSAGRVLRSLAASGAVKEVGKGKYTLSPTYELFANPTFAEGLAHWYVSGSNFGGDMYSYLQVDPAPTSSTHLTKPCPDGLPPTGTKARAIRQTLRCKRHLMRRGRISLEF